MLCSRLGKKVAVLSFRSGEDKGTEFGYDGSEMKWSIKLVTKRKRKQPVRLKANSIDELAEKLSKRSTKFLDFEIETPVNDPDYWKNLILGKLFQKTRNTDKAPTLF